MKETFAYATVETCQCCAKLRKKMEHQKRKFKRLAIQYEQIISRLKETRP